jgi:hypothetical protein
MPLWNDALETERDRIVPLSFDLYRNLCVLLAFATGLGVPLVRLVRKDPQGRRVRPVRRARTACRASR